ncbi:MAG: hypothetical protein K1X64_17410 [Myxococcaceae bacterium]|nr:hypothetical protein [Myxococcaceae bacterium]
MTKLVTSFEVLFDGFTPEQPRRSFHERLNALLRETEAAFNALEPGQAAQFTVLFRDRLHPYFLQANAMARAFHKPLGYAGDYEVMNMAYRNQPEGDSPLGKALHQWFNTTLGATAVRTRRRWILEQMQIHGRDWKGTYKICSVAAGSAYELGDLIHESFLVERCELTCVDQDRSALTFASEQLNEAMQHAERSCPTAFVHDSVHNMVGAGATAARRFTPQSFIYSLGLYDYLPEKVGRLLTRYLYNQLEPGGRLIVGNYAQQTDTRFTIEMVMDWQLLYRSEAQLMALAADLPIGATCRYTAECTGMQLFLIVDKPR